MSLLEAFEQATEQDLEQVTQKIKDLQNQVQKLLPIRTMLENKFGKRKPREVPPRPSEPLPKSGTISNAGLELRRREIVKHLQNAGPKSKQRISEELGINKMGQNCLTTALDCEFFHSNADGIVDLTEKGRKLVTY